MQAGVSLRLCVSSGLWIVVCTPSADRSRSSGMSFADESQLPVLSFMIDAERAGLTRDQVRQRLRSGEWSRLARGAYLPDGGECLDDQDEHARRRTEHGLRAIAAALRNRETVVTDASAALLHGLPIQRVPSNVQLAVPPGAWSGTRSGIDFRIRNFDDDEVHYERVAVASVQRCWIDITRHGTLTDSLVTGDAGMRSGLISVESVMSGLDRWRGQRGCRRLARALQFVDGLRESPLESSSFAYFIEQGVPLPRMQVEIRTQAGVFIARVDFLWDDERLVGEADGIVKCREREELYAEKRREDLIRAQGFQVVRWGWADLRSPALARRLRALLV